MFRKISKKELHFGTAFGAVENDFNFAHLPQFVGSTSKASTICRPS